MFGRIMLPAVLLLSAVVTGQPAGTSTGEPGPVDRPVRTTGCGKTPPAPAGTPATRTIVSGGLTCKSNGGGFAGVLACRLSGRIAASAQVSGAFYPQGGVCEPRRPIPVLEIHGSADTTIPYDGSTAKSLPPIPSWLAGWAARNRCAGGPVTSTPVTTVTRHVWRRCAAAVEHYRIDGLGHDWPSTTPNPDSDVPSVLDATPLIWKFFLRHRLPIHHGH
ncbi:alpha/beta hydrolase family esterase [Actinoplanes philippinensis]|uniref:alpha/beta hydrolase family esterase n=1 Tax=Actinoplanes philippinensis TaxID=35752 RepID=UPI0033D247F1